MKIQSRPRTAIVKIVRGREALQVGCRGDSPGVTHEGGAQITEQIGSAQHQFTEGRNRLLTTGAHAMRVSMPTQRRPASRTLGTH